MQWGNSTIIIIFFIFSLIVGSFFFGIKYSENNLQVDTLSSELKIQPTTVKNIDTKKDLIRRCGEIPDKAYPYYGNFDVRGGPEWSPDCRYIAWSMWESGTSYLGDDAEIQKQIELNPRKLSNREGIFLYRDSDKTVTKIFSPFELDQSPTFFKWEDSQTIVFGTIQGKYKYNLITKEISPTAK